MFDFPPPFYFIVELYGFLLVLLILQKRKRKCVFNQGELDALEYHSKVSWKKCIFCEFMLLGFGHVQNGGHGCKQVLFL